MAEQMLAVGIKCTLLRFVNHGENVGLNFPGKVHTQLR